MSWIRDDVTTDPEERSTTPHSSTSAALPRRRGREPVASVHARPTRTSRPCTRSSVALIDDPRRSRPAQAELIAVVVSATNGCGYASRVTARA